MSVMHLGFFADFQSRDTLLLEADENSLRQLHEMFRSLASKRLRRLALHRLPLMRIHQGVELTAAFAEDNRIARRSSVGNSFLWESSATGWGEVADRLASLAVEPTPCHHAFDAGQGPFVVLVSKGEYGDSWWSEHD